jgi:hypothetical protein
MFLSVIIPERAGMNVIHVREFNVNPLLRPGSVPSR